MTCRSEILSFMAGSAKHEVGRVFTVKEVVDGMMAAGTVYKPSTIRTHITSRMCANAPNNHAVTYHDVERIGKGTYRLK
jgi:hypothetical protein